MRRLLWIPWRWWRRAAQLALLLLFLWLFRRTEYSGANELSGAEHVFFHLDPLAALAPMLAARTAYRSAVAGGNCGRHDLDSGAVLLRLGLPVGDALRLLPPSLAADHAADQSMG